MARVLFQMVLCVVLLAGGAAQAAERRVALVVGNARYEHGGTAPMVAANAAAVAEALRQTGFDVTVANNREHRGLVAALSHFAERARGAELGLIYYSGLTLSAGGRNFLVPVDARLESEGDVAFDTLDLDQVLQQMQAPKRGVLLLDPVVPNPFAAALKTVRPVPGPPGPADTLLIAYAHQPGTPPAPAQGGGAGPFAAALAQELVKPGADLRGALTAVERAVAARTGGAQTPWLQDRLGPTVALLPAAPPEPKVEPLEGAYVTTRDVNLRQAPDSKAAVLRRLPHDTALTATGRVRAGGWTRVTIDGQQGFVSNEYLKRPDAPAAPPPAAVTDTGVRRVVRDATLFDRPALGARGVRDLPAGMLLSVVEAAPDGNWVKVRDRFGQEGYVSAGALTVEAEEGRTLSGSSGPPPSPGGASDGNAAPESVRAARDGVTAGEGAASRARATAQRAAEAQRRAEQAAEAARAGTATAWVHRFANGDVYEGEWAVTPSGGANYVQRNGHGVYRFADGQLYEGEWRDDQMAGVGVMVFRTGDRYAGGFRAGQPEGLGVFRYANGDGYAGEVRGNRPEGAGELSYANGDRYQGRVSDRRPSGFGALTPAGSTLRQLGRFSDGTQDGFGTWQGAGVPGE